MIILILVLLVLFAFGGAFTGVVNELFGSTAGAVLLIILLYLIFKRRK